MFLNIFSKRRKPGVVYWININNINIEAERPTQEIDPEKFEREEGYYLQTGQFWSNIYLKKDNTLVDGYYSYLIAKKFDLGKIPVIYDEV